MQGSNEVGRHHRQIRRSRWWMVLLIAVALMKVNARLSQVAAVPDSTESE
jgi:hypothetical protein